MPIEIVVYDGHEQIDGMRLPGDMDAYDIIIKSVDDVELPPLRQEGKPPAIPEIDPNDIEKKTNRDAYERMANNPDSQPAEVRQLLYQHQMMTRKQIGAWAEDEGYSSLGGGIQSALVVLDNVTDEIERIGDGNEDQRIVWTGAE